MRGPGTRALVGGRRAAGGGLDTETVIAWLVLLIFAVVGGIGLCMATTLGNSVGIGEYRDPRDAACKMTVGDVVVLGRSGGFGSGLNFRRFERIDDDHAGGGGGAGGWRETH
jgi:hypothetical protein